MHLEDDRRVLDDADTVYRGDISTVDPDGRQLPYIDEMILNVVAGALVPAKSGAGESDLQARGINGETLSGEAEVDVIARKDLFGDLKTPLALGELSLFADVAYGKDKNELYSGWAHLANLGVAWDVRLGQHFLSSLSWALPITHKGSEALNDDGAMFFWSLRFAR